MSEQCAASVTPVTQESLVTVSEATTLSGGTSAQDGSNFAWFDPLEYLGELLGANDPLFQYWCGLCGSQGATGDTFSLSGLVNLNEYLPPAAPPQYLCFTPELVNEFTLCGIFAQWIFASFIARYAGVPEASACSEPP